jgi:hypothetical protein
MSVTHIVLGPRQNIIMFQTLTRVGTLWLPLKSTALLQVQILIARGDKTQNHVMTLMVSESAFQPSALNPIVQKFAQATKLHVLHSKITIGLLENG